MSHLILTPDLSATTQQVPEKWLRNGQTDASVSLSRSVCSGARARSPCRSRLTAGRSSDDQDWMHKCRQSKAHAKALTLTPSLTPTPRVHVRVVLVIEIWLIQVSEGLKLHLGILEKAQLHQQCQPHKPKLKTQNIIEIIGYLCIAGSEISIPF